MALFCLVPQKGREWLIKYGFGLGLYEYIFPVIYKL